ncbi:hypothetical protein [Streptomyces fragilis]|uniref:Uncharacterized protein n=1 Tax=Streptomyces fragilis TaxID=67301 RepID=A0ABV2YDE7_9ACTN|nr:hypothetical protein [Streptomyces fragilis]
MTAPAGLVAQARRVGLAAPAGLVAQARRVALVAQARRVALVALVGLVGPTAVTPLGRDALGMVTRAAGSPASVLPGLGPGRVTVVTAPRTPGRGAFVLRLSRDRRKPPVTVAG